MTYVWQQSCVSSIVHQVSANFIFPLRPCSSFKTSGDLQFIFLGKSLMMPSSKRVVGLCCCQKQPQWLSLIPPPRRDDKFVSPPPGGGGYRGLSRSCGRRQWPAYLFVMYFDRFSSRVQVFNDLCIDWLPWSVLPLRVGWMTWPKRPTRSSGGCDGRRACTCPTRS